jgi:hypothetical protein
MELSDYVKKLIAEIKEIRDDATVHSVTIVLDAEGKPTSATISIG